MLPCTLGTTGIKVSPLRLGCWPIGGHLVQRGANLGLDHTDDAVSIRALACAVDFGSPSSPPHLGG